MLIVKLHLKHERSNTQTHKKTFSFVHLSFCPFVSYRWSMTPTVWQISTPESVSLSHDQRLLHFM